MREGVNISSTARKRRWNWGYAGVIALCAVLAYAQWFLWGYVPVSTLPVREEPEVDLQKVCVLSDEKYAVYPNEIKYYLLQIWPPSVHGQPIPAYSPDGRYYVEVTEHSRGDEIVRQELRLFEAGSNRLLGSYSYFRLRVPCWAKDSSGVYLEHYIPSARFVVDITPELAGERMKVLIPCRGSLGGVSLLPRLYWEMRCALPGSEYSPFAIWFPLVVLLLALAGAVRLVLWLWRHWGRPWWYGPGG